jgi:hypothetical protein
MSKIVGYKHVLDAHGDKYFVFSVAVDEDTAEKYLGSRCETYQSGCPCCDGWKEWDEYGWVEIQTHEDVFVHWLLRDGDCDEASLMAEEENHE